MWRGERWNRNEAISFLVKISVSTLHKVLVTVLLEKTRVVIGSFNFLLLDCKHLDTHPFPFYLFPPFVSSIACFILEVGNVSGWCFFSGITIAVGLQCCVPRSFMFQNGAELLCHSSSLKDHCNHFADKECEYTEETAVNYTAWELCYLQKEHGFIEKFCSFILMNFLNCMSNCTHFFFHRHNTDRL